MGIFQAEIRSRPSVNPDQTIIPGRICRLPGTCHVNSDCSASAALKRWSSSAGGPFQLMLFALDRAFTGCSLSLSPMTCVAIVRELGYLRQRHISTRAGTDCDQHLELPWHHAPVPGARVDIFRVQQAAALIMPACPATVDISAALRLCRQSAVTRQASRPPLRSLAVMHAPSRKLRRDA